MKNIHIIIAVLWLAGLTACHKDINTPTGIVYNSSNSSYSNGDNFSVTVNGVSFGMKYVEGGDFRMGASSEQEGIADENEYPVHKVTLSGFWICETEVTEELWLAVFNNGSKNTSDMPARNVSWNEIVNEFLPRLRLLTGKDFRLPTEAEWEYAARGGNQSQGYIYAGSDNIGEVTYIDETNSLFSSVFPVKRMKPNELGLYDMSGNVWEWCNDRFGDYSGDAQFNPVGMASGNKRVLRGGGWKTGGDSYCRVSCRKPCKPNERNEEYGFRLVLSGEGHGIAASSDAPQGALKACFSVSPTLKVWFSQGNLQYQPSTATWRFASKQYDLIGDANHEVYSGYEGWIDLFGWGTSGFNHGAVCYQPWSNSETESDYYVYGSTTCGLYDMDGTADWGYNRISNGGDAYNRWRTMTYNEWRYLLFKRSTSSGIRFAKATVNGVCGIVVLPDEWNQNVYPLNNTNKASADYNSNIISGDLWEKTFQPKGVVFLPICGLRIGNMVYYVDTWGLYWTSTIHLDSKKTPYYLIITSEECFLNTVAPRKQANSVRLVTPADR